MKKVETIIILLVLIMLTLIFRQELVGLVRWILFKI